MSDVKQEERIWRATSELYDILDCIVEEDIEHAYIEGLLDGLCADIKKALEARAQKREAKS